MSSKLLCLLSLVLVFILAGFSQAELLPNPGFEDGKDSWGIWGGGSGAGWAWNSSFHAEVKEDGTAHGGDKYVEAVLPGWSEWYIWAGMWVYQNHAATEGKTYQISAWVRDGDADGTPSVIPEGFNMTFEWRDAAPTSTSGGDDTRGEKLPDHQITYNFDLTGEWTYVSGTEVAPAGAKGLTAAFWANVDIRFDIDDASLVEVVPVATVAELEAAAVAADAGTKILLAEGIYELTSSIDIKSGTIFEGAGADLTIIDCNGLCRAFTAWGDRSATGLLDPNGVEIPNRTGPTDWVIDGLTIQNGVTAEEDDGLELGDDGGGVLVLNGASGTIQNCTFLDCSAVDDGGAIRVGGASVLNVNNCSFSGMFSGDDGGVLFLNGGGTMSVDQCVIVDSLAGDRGGAGYTGSADSFFSLTNSVVDNVDADDDGAVFRAGNQNAGGLYMANCIVTNCDAVDDNVIWLRGRSSKVLNCTFVNNTCGDKGIIGERTNADNADVEHVISNNIFVGNSNAGSGDDLLEDGDFADQPATVTNSLFFQKTIDSGEIGVGVVLGENGNVEGDPLFVGPDDFHIASADSPAVDGGADVGLTADIEGNARAQGNASDIGAYEFVE